VHTQINVSTQEEVLFYFGTATAAQTTKQQQTAKRYAYTPALWPGIALSSAPGKRDKYTRDTE
jgi:hypothetical protein